MAAKPKIRKIKTDSFIEFVIENDSIGLSNGPRIRELIKQDALAISIQEIRVNLKAVEYIDSYGISIIIATVLDLKKHRKVLTLVETPKLLRDIFELNQIDKLIDIKYSS